MRKILKASALAVVAITAVASCGLDRSPLVEELARTGSVDVAVAEGQPTAFIRDGKVVGAVAVYGNKLVACDFPTGASQAAVVNNWRQPIETAVTRPGASFVWWPGIGNAKCLAKLA